MHDVESDLGFHHGPEVIPRTFPMTWATKFDPLTITFTVIVRSLRPEVEILLSSQSITDELRETECVDQRHKYNDRLSSVPAASIVFSVPSAVSDPAAVCVEETPSLSSISSISSFWKRKMKEEKKILFEGISDSPPDQINRTSLFETFLMMCRSTSDLSLLV